MLKHEALHTKQNSSIVHQIIFIFKLKLRQLELLILNISLILFNEGFIIKLTIEL
jgi:hypothetical protein